MKMIIAVLSILVSTQTFAASARGLEGDYQVAKGCKVDNSRITPLVGMYFEGTPVTIESRPSEGLLLFTAEHNTVALPFSSDTSLESMFFGDYYKNADIRVTEKSYAMRTKGSEWKSCDNSPFPGHRPCLKKWDDTVAMAVSSQGDLQIEWRIENTHGTCLLQRSK